MIAIIPGMSLLRVWLPAGLLCTGMVACSVGPPEPGAEPREGPAAAWTMSTPTGASNTLKIGRVLVVHNAEALFGIDPANGRHLWRVASTEKTRLSVSGDLLVHREPQTEDTETISVVEAAEGRILWRKSGVSELRVTADAIFTNVCADDACTLVRHDPRNGKERWSVRNGGGALTDDAIGARPPFTAESGSAMPTDFRTVPDRSWGAIDTSSGRLLKGRSPDHAWYEVVVGRTLVTSDHDPESGDKRCTVTLTAVDADSGRRKWTREVFGGRKAGGDCEKILAGRDTRLTFISAGSRIAASTVNGYPQVFDLATGRTVWRGDTPGVPIDGDGRTLLVRQEADAGGLALLDFATGRRLWTAPDPGLEGSSASWETHVTGRLVAVSGATGSRPHVLVYRVADGRRLGRFPGWLQGLGDDWAAIGHSSDRTAVGKLQFDFVRF